MSSAVTYSTSVRKNPECGRWVCSLAGAGRTRWAGGGALRGDMDVRTLARNDANESWDVARDTSLVSSAKQPSTLCSSALYDSRSSGYRDADEGRGSRCVAPADRGTPGPDGHALDGGA